MKRHDWRELTEDGDKRLWRATKHGGVWKLYSRMKSSDDEFQRHDPMSLDELRMLREVLFNKYQRKRLPWGDIEKMDAMIEDAEKVENEAAPAGEVVEE